MIKKIALILTFFNFCFAYSQIIINEIDADTPGTDVLEFVELKSTTPNFSLNGYVLVFFNGGSAGTGIVSYNAIDLDGFTTDINGNFLIGNSQVSPAPSLLFDNAILQNGPDAIALFQGNASDFPVNTNATNVGLIDALAYSNSTTVQPTALMSIFGLSVCTNENQTSQATTKSIQRNNDGTYSVSTPTPGVNNDGSGVVLNAITITPSATVLTEGDVLSINFSTAFPVADSNLIINMTLNNGSFTLLDFSGSLTTFIPVGATSVVKNFTIVDDTAVEGDEELIIRVNSIQSGYALANNNIVIRVHDSDNIVQPWGTPLNPTHGIVTPTYTTNYYSSLEGLSGENLKLALQNIIANPDIVHAHTYGDVSDILLVADQNPANSSEVWMMYVEQPRSKIDYQTGNSNIGVWNREHIWPQSRGGFADATSSFSDGINVWLPTGPNDITAGHSDAHHIRAEDGAENSLRSNRDYGSDYNGPAGNVGSWKGDVARSLFYMAIRYNGLNLVNGNPADNIVGQMGDLASLLDWNHTDTADDFEMNRNNYIQTWQNNRNPFIDYPSLADYIFGANYGQPWFSTLSTTNFTTDTISIYPNPMQNTFTIAGLEGQSRVEVYNQLGELVFKDDFSGTQHFTMNVTTGIYFAKISNDTKVVIKKLVVK
ncbi:MAG: endonuclease [Flavobacterium sp.]|nr:endonuclease [Flavobacterium sp.]